MHQARVLTKLTCLWNQLTLLHLDLPSKYSCWTTLPHYRPTEQKLGNTRDSHMTWNVREKWMKTCKKSHKTMVLKNTRIEIYFLLIVALYNWGIWWKLWWCFVLVYVKLTLLKIEKEEPVFLPVSLLSGSIKDTSIS